MKLTVFAIKDTKSDSYGTPFFQPTRGLALRMFVDLASDGQSVISKHPTDFALFEIGSFDQVEGSLSSLGAPEFLGLATDLVAAVSARQAA